MSLNNFISEISKNNGLARNNRFSILLTKPDFITMDNSSLQTLNLFCDTAQLPGININTNQVRVYGEIREVPYEISYEPVTLTFYVDNNLMVKKFFDEWLLGVNIGDSRNFRYYDEYAKSIQIDVEDLNDRSLYRVYLMEAYPKNVSAVSLDYASKDVMKLSVTFQYKYWRSEQLSGENEFAYDEATYPPEKYLNNFIDYQMEVNKNLGFVFPEGIGEFTGITPIRFL